MTHMASGGCGDLERAQQEFNDQQMLPQQSAQPQPTMQQQQQIQPKKEAPVGAFKIGRIG
jgi:hypothetical protein